MWAKSDTDGSGGQFFIAAAEGDTALWNFTLADGGGFEARAFLLSIPDSKINDWSDTSLKDVKAFGLRNLYADSYNATSTVDWLRLPDTDYIPYDSSLIGFRSDWWEAFCYRLMMSLADTMNTSGFVFEGWNEVDRLVTRAGNPDLEETIHQIYQATAAAFDSFEVDVGTSHLLSSHAFSDPKDTTFSRSYLQFAKDSSLTMDLYGTHSYSGSPNTVLEKARITRDFLDSDTTFAGIPIYITVYMDYITQDFRKDTNHRAAQWLMTMLKMEEANRVESLNVVAMPTHGYKDWNPEDNWSCNWPYNIDRQFYGALGLLTNLENQGAKYKASANVYRMVKTMGKYQVDVEVKTPDGMHQYWVKGIASRKDTLNVQNDVLSILVVNFDNAMMVEETLVVDIDGLPSGSVSVKLYRIDQTTSSLCFDGGWGKPTSTTAIDLQDTTGTKFWITNDPAMDGLTLVDSANESFTIDRNDKNTLELTGTTQPAPGIYHILNESDGQSLAMVDSSSVSVVAGKISREVIMPINSVTLLRIFKD